MNNYVFMTDSDSDLPLYLKQKWDIPVVSMPYTLDGKEYFDDLGQTLDSKSFFDKMRAGAKASTSALNEETYLEIFQPILKDQDILFIAFSSKMSCTIQAVYSAREKLLAKYPERKFRVVDTLSISCCMSLLLIKAHEMYEAGADMETVAQWIEANRLRAHAVFTVDDLNYLKRGGRITGTAAVLGSLLDLKPILTINREGLVAAADKVRGRKRALNSIVERAANSITDETECPGIIMHADAAEDAERLRALVTARFPKMELIMTNIGPVIGSHAGPGTVAFCFMGKERE